jgi:membrane protease YdiL (CAAX protease family)
MFLAARLLAMAMGYDVPGYPFDTPWGWLAPVLFALVNDPGGVEELGWRGFALPMLQRRFGALNAALILGVIWGIWHLPAFMISGTNQSATSLPIFLVGSVAFSVLLAYTTTVWLLVAIVLVLVLGAKNLGSAEKITEPLDIPWEDGEGSGDSASA